MTWQSVTLETREPHDLFLVAATTAVTGLEIAVQLNEIPAYLRELDRRELVIQAPARFLPIRNRAVRIDNLEIIEAIDEPIGLERADPGPVQVPTKCLRRRLWFKRVVFATF